MSDASAGLARLETGGEPPYSVASPILVELAQGEAAPRRIVVTLQLEVARRLAAGPDHADYGVLTLLVQRDFVPADWFKIPPAHSFPNPRWTPRA